MKWTLLVPLKVLPSAKSRLAAALTPAQHAELVDAIRADTIAVARQVGRVVVVADRPAPDADLVQHSPGLNGALRDAAEFARSRWPADGVTALVGDLPAVKVAELSAALIEAGEGERAFVPDTAGTGTTLLTARPGVGLDPRFGIGSARRHAETAMLLPAGPGLRCDVDTAADLAAAEELGVGAATTAVLASWTRGIARSS